MNCLSINVALALAATNGAAFMSPMGSGSTCVTRGSKARKDGGVVFTCGRTAQA